MFRILVLFVINKFIFKINLGSYIYFLTCQIDIKQLFFELF